MFTLVTTAKYFFPGFAYSLYQRNLLKKLTIGYPKWKLRGLSLPNEIIDSFTLWHPSVQFLSKSPVNLPKIQEYLVVKDSISMDIHAQKNYESSHIFAMSGMSLSTGKLAQSHGKLHIVSRASQHILSQLEILENQITKWDFQIPVPSQRIIERELEEYENADFIIVPSKIAKLSFERHGFSQDKVFHIPFPTKLSFFESQFRDNPRSNENILITFVGQLTLRKGIPTLLQAFNLLPQRNIELHLIGPIKKDFMHYLSNNGLIAEKVHLYGPMPHDKIRDLLRRTTLFVMPSVEEGWPIAIMEAISSGCIPIISDAVALVDEIPFLDENMIFESSNEYALREKIEFFLDNREQLELARRRFSTMKSTSRDWSNYVSELLSAIGLHE